MTRRLGWIIGAAFLALGGIAYAHSVGQIQTTKFFAPETVTLLTDRAIAGHPGFQVGDTISYIIQYTPVSNGATTGVAGYITDYIPSGTEVVGAWIVDSTYAPISPSLPAGIDTGWGNTFGQQTYLTPFNVSAYDPTGLCASGGFTNNCNGRLTEGIADTGIFYSTDPRTAQYPAPPTRIAQGTNGYNINPNGTGVATLNSLLGQASPTTHNLWDADQTNAFGTSVLPGAPRSSQPIINSGRGAAPFFAGSPVAGPETGYPLDNTGQVGPWQRIYYSGSRMGNAFNGPATNAGSCTTCVGGLYTSLGWFLSSGNPLPAGTNAVRWATGKIVVGEMRYVKISLRLTAPVPPGGLVNGSEVFGGDAGDADGGIENTWDYHVPSVADNNSNLFVLKTVIGYNCSAASPFTCTPSDGGYIPANTRVRYQIVYLNSGNSTQTNVSLADTLPCQTPANSVSNINIVSGPIGLPAPNPPVIAAGTNGLTCPSGSRKTFSFPTIASLGPGVGGSIQFDVQTNAALNSIVPNTAKITSTDIPTGVSTVANSYVQNAPDLRITKTTSTPSVTAGGTATYTITVTNAGTAAASAINVYDLLPTTGGASNAATRFSYASTTSIAGMTSVVPTTAVPPTLTPYNTGGVSSNQQQVRWNFGAQTLAAGSSFTITFNATVGASVPASATPYFNTAAVTYTGGTVTRADITNIAGITVTSPLSVTKNIDCYYIAAVCVPYSNFIPINAKVRYRIDYANPGPSNINNVALSDLLPCQTAANSVSAITIVSGPIGLPATNPPVLAAGNCGTSTRQTFSFSTAATLNAGQSGQITLEVQTNAAAGNTVVNTVTLSGTGTASVSSEVQTTVQTAPSLTISKTESVTGSKVGNTVSYTLTVYNSGTANATNISVYDWLPSGGSVLNAATRFSFVAGTSVFGGSIAGVTPTAVIPPTKANYTTNPNAANMQEVAWNFTAQTLAPGASFSITYNATIGASVPAGYYSNYSRVYYTNSTLTGTAAATNGSATITGTGTLFTTQATVGNVLSIGGVYYTVQSIASNTSLTLTTPYTGTTAAGLTVTKSSQADSAAASMYVSSLIADVAVTKTNGSAFVPFGGTTTYTIVVSNNGPDPAAAPDSGVISMTFNAAGKTITRSAGSFITDGFAVGNKITTDAALNPGPFTIVTVTALVITVNETVVNEGPVSKTVVAPTFVFDAAVPGLSKTGVTCAAGGGAVCPATLTVSRLEGSGLAITTFPSGGQITLTVTANVTAPNGNVTNSVTAVLPSNMSDSNWNNNTASDTDTVALLPSITMVKSLQTFSDPFNASTNPKAIPGAIMSYSITVTNSGSGATDSGTVVITDAVPANTELFVGDVGGVGSGPVAFVNGVPSSGLTYTFISLSSGGDDVSFSDNGGSTYAYNPTANPDGVDPAVTHLRINPKGVFNGNSSFTLTFRVRIK